MFYGILNYLMPTLPTPIIDETSAKYNKINVYVDVKNAMKSLFIEDIEQQLVNASEMNGNLNSYIFQSLLLYSIEWMKYGKIHGKEVEMFFCTDVGQSMYHLGIHKKYKNNRDISSRIGVNGQSDEMKELRDKNFLLSDKILNRIKNIHFYVLKFLESDFLPHYLINEYSRKSSSFDETLHIIVSGDKDMYQSLTDQNIIMYYQTSGKNKVNMVVDKYTCIPHYIKIDKVKSMDKKRSKLELCKKIPVEFIPLMMAFVGDAVDDVPGVESIGPVGALSAMTDASIKECLSSENISELESIIDSNGFVFNESAIPLNSMGKSLQKCVLANEVVTKAFKLISYNSLIKWLKKEDTTQKIDWIKYMDSITNKVGIDCISDSYQLYSILLRLKDLLINEEEFSVIM